MPIGDYAAGSFAAGHDAVAETDRARRAYGYATKFDPATREYALLPDQNVELIHPVMHRVAHLLGIRRGGLPSTPDLGFDVEAVRRSTKATAQRVSQDAARRALKPLLDAGDVEITRVLAVVVPSWNGQIEIDVKNLRDRGSEPIKFRTASR